MNKMVNIFATVIAVAAPLSVKANLSLPWTIYTPGDDTCQPAPLSDFPESASPTAFEKFLLGQNILYIAKNHTDDEGNLMGVEISWHYKNQAQAILFFPKAQYCAAFKTLFDGNSTDNSITLH